MTGPSKEEKEEVDEVIQSLIDDLEELRKRSWNNDKFLLSIDMSTDVTPAHRGHAPGGYRVGPTITDFSIRTPEFKWKVSKER